jgi:Tol biopolymer transport system component
LTLSEEFSHPALSPDGTRVVYPAIDQNAIQSLWMRSLADARAMRLAGTEGARFPFWSPDGRSIGFFVNDQLRTMNAAEGAVRTICASVLNPSGGSWGVLGDIILGGLKASFTAGLMDASAKHL